MTKERAMNSYRAGELWRDDACTLPRWERVFQIGAVNDDGSAVVVNVSRPNVTSTWSVDRLAVFPVAGNPVYLVDLDPLLGDRLHVVLTDGSSRNGIVTRVEYAEIEFMGLMVRRPDRLVFDNEGSDWLTWDMLALVERND